MAFWKWSPLDSVLKLMDTGRERASPDKDSLPGQTAFMPLSLLGPGGHLHVSSFSKEPAKSVWSQPPLFMPDEVPPPPSLSLPCDVWPATLAAFSRNSGQLI